MYDMIANARFFLAAESARPVDLDLESSCAAAHVMEKARRSQSSAMLANGTVMMSGGNDSDVK